MIFLSFIILYTHCFIMGAKKKVDIAPVPPPPPVQQEKSTNNIILVKTLDGH